MNNHINIWTVYYMKPGLVRSAAQTVTYFS